MNPLIHERHISFAIHNENDSNDSRHTTIVMNEDDGKEGNIPTGERNKREKYTDLICVVPTTTVASKSKLIRRNSAKARKLSVRTKEKSMRSKFID